MTPSHCPNDKEDQIKYNLKSTVHIFDSHKKPIVNSFQALFINFHTLQLICINQFKTTQKIPIYFPAMS